MSCHVHFSRCLPAAILDLIWVILDHPRRVVAGLRLILKFGLIVSEILRFIYFEVLA